MHFWLTFGKELVRAILAIQKLIFWSSQNPAYSEVFSEETNLGMVLWIWAILWSPHERMGYHGYFEIDENPKNALLTHFW